MTNEDNGSVAVSLEEDHLLVTLTGEVDLALSDDLDQAGGSALAARQPIVVDVQSVTFMDSVGGSFLVRLASAVVDGGDKLTMRGPCQRVEELLTLMGANSLISWETST